MVSFESYCLTQVCSLPQVGEGERGGGEDQVGVLQPDDCAGHRHQRMQGHQAGSRGTQGQLIRKGSKLVLPWFKLKYTPFRPVSVEVGSGKLRSSVESTLGRNFPPPTSTLTGRNWVYKEPLEGSPKGCVSMDWEKVAFSCLQKVNRTQLINPISQNPGSAF